MSNSLHLIACVLVLACILPDSSRADSGHGNHEHSIPTKLPTSSNEAWAVLTATRDAIGRDIERGALPEIHAKAELLPELTAALIGHSQALDAAKRARAQGAANQIARLAGALHAAADRGDPEGTRKELSRLDAVMKLLQVQYPAEALQPPQAKSAHDPSSDGESHAHAHAEMAAGEVRTAPKTKIRIQAVDPFRFQPDRLSVQAGVPTEIALVNAGVAEHSLVVKTPDGARDWIHLHARPGEIAAATYRLDQPGTYPIVCSIAGHTEGGMIGELVVAAP